MKPPSQAGVDADARRTATYLSGLLAAAVFFVVLETLTVALFWQEQWLLLLLGTTAVFSVVVAVARAQARSGRPNAAILLMLAGLFASIALLAVTIPALAPVYLCLTIGAGGLVLPRFEGWPLRGLLFVCWAMSVSVVLANVCVPGLPVARAPYLDMIAVLGVAWCAGLALFLVAQYSLWLRGVIVELDATNADLVDRSARLRAALDENEEARADLARHAADLERSNQDLEQFAYVASHDLQEPLRMVAAYTELLDRRYADRLDDKGRRYMAYTVDGANRMRALVNDLLAYSRAGREHRPEVVPLEEVVQNALSELDTSLRASGGTVSVGALPAVRGDRGQLVRVFVNLIGNAVKYARPDVTPQIEIVAATAVDGAVSVEIRDNGVGFDPAHAERIFGMFQRLHRDGPQGTGIGLAVVRKLVSRQGGRVWATGEPDRGATFTLTLPRVKPDGEA